MYANKPSFVAVMVVVVVYTFSVWRERAREKCYCLEQCQIKMFVHVVYFRILNCTLTPPVHRTQR